MLVQFEHAETKMGLVRDHHDIGRVLRPVFKTVVSDFNDNRKRLRREEKDTALTGPHDCVINRLRNEPLKVTDELSEASIVRVDKWPGSREAQIDCHV